MVSPAAVAEVHQDREGDQRAEEGSRAGDHDRGRPPRAGDQQGPPRYAEEEYQDRGDREAEQVGPQGTPYRRRLYRFTR